MFVDRLINGIKKLDNPSVAGLDPKLEYIPSCIRKLSGSAGRVRRRCGGNNKVQQKLIDALCDIVPAVKPQLAYYEMYGIEGMRAFAETCRHARARACWSSRTENAMTSVPPHRRTRLHTWEGRI